MYNLQIRVYDEATKTEVACMDGGYVVMCNLSVRFLLMV